MNPCIGIFESEHSNVHAVIPESCGEATDSRRQLPVGHYTRAIVRLVLEPAPAPRPPVTLSADERVDATALERACDVAGSRADRRGA